MKVLFGLLLLFVTFQAPAQLLKKLKDQVVNKAEDKAKTKARSLVSDELASIRSEFDSTDFDYAILLSDNSGLFGGKRKGEFGGKFLRIGGLASSLRKDDNLSDAEIARLSVQMGQTAYAMGRFVFAEKRFKNASTFFERAGLTSDIEYLKTIASQGLLYTTMGRYKQAEKFTTLAMKMRGEKFGVTHMGMAAGHNNYAVLHYNLGHYNESEKEFTRAIGIVQSNDQRSAMPYAIVLNNQAILFQSMGRYPEAVKILLEAIGIASNLEASKAKNHLKFYSNLALLYQQMDKHTEAENIYMTLAKKLEKGKPEYANMLNNLAILYLVMNKHEKIEEMLKESASIYKSNLGENSPAFAKVISDLGNFYRYKERYAEAEPLLEKSLLIREESLGNTHPLYVQSKEDLAILQWKKKDLVKANVLYRDVMEKSLDFINRYFPPMSEAEKTRYWDILAPRFQRFYNFAVEASLNGDPIITDLFEYRVATKGLLLNSARQVTESILASDNEQLINDYESWLDHKEELARLYVYSKDELKEQTVDLDSLEAITNAMEKKLSENSKEFARFYFTEKIRYSEIRDRLKDDEALIEIIRLRNYDQAFTSDCRYLGLVVTKKNQHPRLVILTNGLDMETQFSRNYRLSMKNRVNDEQSYNRYWAAFEPEVKGKEKIYVSLDGVYNQINLNTLKKPGGDYLINKLDIILLGNPKGLLTNTTKSKANPVKNATLIGFPDYGSDRIPELPATKMEVDSINRVLKSSGYKVSEFIQKEATETNLKNAKRASILHIATHGYFLQDVEKASWPIGVHADYARDNVLLRSGLMLTGASDAGKITTGLDSTSNGIITSFEAMNLDLEGTSLVVLSACETGLGEIKAGEGVYGLQRAFLAAGTGALVMSLWKVDDAATQQLMKSFYSNWIKSGDKQKAFKEAQLQLMKKYKDPYYWGAFVMMEN